MDPAEEAKKRAKRASNRRTYEKTKAKRDADPVARSAYLELEKQRYHRRMKEGKCPRKLLTLEEKLERRRARQKKWRDENRDKYRGIVAKSAIKGLHRKKALRNEMAGPVPERCPICLNSFEKTGQRRPVYDHCHQGGHFRSWLCNGCNATLGHAEDDPERLMRAAHYLLLDRSRNPLPPVLRDPSFKRKI